MILLDKVLDERNIEKILSFYADNAKIMIGGANPVVVSKAMYGEILFKKPKDTSYTFISKTAPRINLLDPDEAEVKCVIQIMTSRFRCVHIKMRFVKVKEEWFIKKSTYYTF